MFAVSAKSRYGISIGASKYGGTIFYIDASGRHGLVVADYDLGNWGGNGSTAPPVYETQWPSGGSPSPSYLGTDVAKYTSIYGGQMATQLFINNNTSRWIAPLAGFQTSGSYSDWYLPNKQELYELMKIYWYDNSGTIPNLYNPPFEQDSPPYGTVQEYTSNPSTTIWYWYSGATPPYMDDISKITGNPFRPIRRF